MAETTPPTRQIERLTRDGPKFSKDYGLKREALRLEIEAGLRSGLAVPVNVEAVIAERRARHRK